MSSSPGREAISSPNYAYQKAIVEVSPGRLGKNIVSIFGRRSVKIMVNIGRLNEIRLAGPQYSLSVLFMRVYTTVRVGLGSDTWPIGGPNIPLFKDINGTR